MLSHFTNIIVISGVGGSRVVTELLGYFQDISLRLCGLYRSFLIFMQRVKIPTTSLLGSNFQSSGWLQNEGNFATPY